jgi:oxygen-independent coproporphyrinogen-3 oxidase
MSETAPDPTRRPSEAGRGPGRAPPPAGPAEPIQAPPLGLYIHSPWCLRKCPYCDFNSHVAQGEPPFAAYVGRLLEDLDRELLDPGARRPIESCFIGGGTPSLLPGESVRALLDGVRARTGLAADCEVTLEANPGAADAGRFAAYREAGVNRISIGVQSLSGPMLERLGRIHDAASARAAVASARRAGLDNLNLDLMFALPGQTLAEAAADLDAVLDLGPEHLSYYQLTLEPNTPFHARPPELPDPDLAADMAEQGRERLARAGFAQYEVSAFARAGRSCRHNLNYWRFGDYLGIGAGAHGKLTDPATGAVRRRAKLRHPLAYLAAPPQALTGEERLLGESDLIFELALNGFRLVEGIERGRFECTTGLPWSRVLPRLEGAQADGLVTLAGDLAVPTELGRAFADTLIARFLPGAVAGRATR